ncbi:MAG: putative DNA base hypermodification protein [Planctomycetaceae bacterium]
MTTLNARVDDATAKLHWKQQELEFEPKPARRPTATPSRPSILRKLKPTIVFDTYWRFATERQEMFLRRARGQLPPWTDDPILSEYRFTNVYRASDRVSQYLIRNVIYSGEQSPKEVFFRTLLFKIFNKIETWELLVCHFGLPTSSDFNVEHYSRVLSREIESGKAIYSAAYIMPSGPKSSHDRRKHDFHLSLLSQMLKDNLPEQIADAGSLQGTYNHLLACPSIGPFLAYQFTIDLNYSDFLQADEMEFVVPGPGALDGISKCFAATSDFSPADIVRMVTEHQSEEFERGGLTFRDLWGRPLQLIDCQNIFCEISKYARVRHPEIAGVANRTRIKQKYCQTDSPVKYWFPPKWNLNDAIEEGTLANG